MRVAAGGRNIPEAVVRRRYEVSFERLTEAVETADSSLVFDNTEEAGPSLLIRINGRVVETNRLLARPLLHRRVAAAVGKALDMSLDDLLATGPG